jgi:hypothetical protein
MVPLLTPFAATADVTKILSQMQASPTGVRFADLAKVCEHFFGTPRQSGSSHAVFKTPWPGDPRVNIRQRQGQGQGLPGAPGAGGHQQVERAAR